MLSQFGSEDTPDRSDRQRTGMSKSHVSGNSIWMTLGRVAGIASASAHHVDTGRSSAWRQQPKQLSGALPEMLDCPCVKAPRLYTPPPDALAVLRHTALNWSENVPKLYTPPPKRAELPPILDVLTAAVAPEALKIPPPMSPVLSPASPVLFARKELLIAALPSLKMPAPIPASNSRTNVQVGPQIACSWSWIVVKKVAEIELPEMFELFTANEPWWLKMPPPAPRISRFDCVSAQPLVQLAEFVWVTSPLWTTELSDTVDALRVIRPPKLKMPPPALPMARLL